MTFFDSFSSYFFGAGTGSHCDKGNAGKPGSEGPQVSRDLHVRAERDHESRRSTRS